MDKKIAFIGFSEDRRDIFESFVEDNDYKLVFIDQVDEIFNQVYNLDIHYHTIFISSSNQDLIPLATEIREHLKTISLNLVIYEDDNPPINKLEIDNYIYIDKVDKNHFLTLLRSSEKLTELLDTGLLIANDHYHFEFFKKLIHIEIKRAKRYDIHLTLMYLTFDNGVEIENSRGVKGFRKLFTDFTNKITTSIRDIDIPITFGDESILILMPHTNKSGANVVAERIYNKLLKNHKEIQFSIAIASSERDDLSYSNLMTAIHEGVDESRSVGGNKIVVK